MYVCMCVCVYVCMCVYVYVCMCVCVYVFMYVCMSVRCTSLLFWCLVFLELLESLLSVARYHRVIQIIQIIQTIHIIHILQIVRSHTQVHLGRACSGTRPVTHRVSRHRGGEHFVNHRVSRAAPGGSEALVKHRVSVCKIECKHVCTLVQLW